MTVLDIGPLVAWAAALSTLLSLGTAIWTALTAGARKADKRLDDLMVRTDALERQVERLSAQLTNVPTGDMIHRVELSIARMEGHIEKFDERLKPVAAIAERMQELMLDQARR